MANSIRGKYSAIKSEEIDENQRILKYNEERLQHQNDKDTLAMEVFTEPDEDELYPSLTILYYFFRDILTLTGPLKKSQDTAPFIPKRGRELISRRFPVPRFNIYLIYIISIVDIALFVASIVMNGGFEPFSVNPMLGPSAYILGKKVKEKSCWSLERTMMSILLIKVYHISLLYTKREGQWWRLITPIFLHAGAIHVTFNLMFQIQQGVPLEREFGSLRIFVLYMLSGVGGNIMSSIFLPTSLSVGASGSLFGLLGTILAALLKNWGDLKRPCVSIFFILLMIAVNLFIGLLPYIDNFAHVGGLFSGLFFGLVIIPSRSERMRNIVLTAFGFAAGSVGLAVGLFILYNQFDVHDWCTWCMCIIKRIEMRNIIDCFRYRLHPSKWLV